MHKIPNLYECPLQQWKKRSPAAQNMFNYCIRTGDRFYKAKMYHPNMILPVDHFSTINWNNAWMAAEHVDKDLLRFPKVDGKKNKQSKSRD